MNLSKQLLAVGLTGAIVIGASALQGPGGRDPLPWSKAAGRPTMGDKPGVFIWHEGNTVTIASQSEHKKTASIKVMVQGGKITDVRRIRDERGDTITYPKDNVVEFKARTNDGRDEIRFNVVGGKALVVNVRQPDERDRPIFIGDGEIRTERNNVVFNMNK